MTQPRETDPTLKPIRSLAELSQEAGALATRITLFADSLSNDRNIALLEVNETLADTEMADEWPLNKYSLRVFFADKADIVLKKGGPNTENFVSVGGLEHGKYYPETLAYVYPESVSPRLDFASDLIKWTGAMERRDRALLLAIDLGEGQSSRVEIEVYEDLEIVRENFKNRTEISDPEEIEEDVRAYTWIGERVIVRASTDEIEALKQASASKHQQPE